MIDQLCSVRSTQGESSTTPSGIGSPARRMVCSAARRMEAPADSASATTRSLGQVRRNQRKASTMSVTAAGQGCSGASR